MVRRRRRASLIVAAALATASTRAYAQNVEDVSVAGTRLSETGGSAHVVGDKQLRRFAYDDAEQVLLQVPGVYVRTEDGVGLRPNIGIRGANSDRSKKVTFMEDGVLVGPAPYSAPAAYYVPLIDRMRTVRVVKGPSSIVYGPQTVGGAIDMLTRDIPSERKGTYDLAVGQYGFNKQHLSFGSSDEHIGFLVEGLRVDTSGFKDIDGGGDSGFTRNEWMGKVSWVPDPTSAVGNELRLKGTYAGEVSNETYLGVTDADLRATPDRRYYPSRDDRMENHRTSLELTHELRVPRVLTMTTTAYRHDFDRIWRKVNGFRGADMADVLLHPDTPANRIYYGVLTGQLDATDAAQAIMIGPNHRQFVSEGVQTEVRTEVKTGPIEHRFTYGARLHYDEIRRLHTQDGFLMESGQLVSDGQQTQVTVNNYAGTYALAMWAVDAMAWGPVIVTPGVRMEAIHVITRDTLTGAHDGVTYREVLPGASAYWAMVRSKTWGELGMLGGVHKGFTPVTPEQARSESPEESINYEAGFRWSKKRARVEAVGFYNDYSNLTDVCESCAEGIVDKQFQAGSARIAGLELYGDGEIRIDEKYSVPVRAAYTYTYTELLETFKSADPQFGDVHAGDELPYVPPHQASAGIGIEHAGEGGSSGGAIGGSGAWGLNVNGTFVDAMWEHAGHGNPLPGDKTDAYFLLDASARYRLWKQLEVYVNGRNLTNDRYVASRRPFGARPGAPLWILGGVRGEF